MATSVLASLPAAVLLIVAQRYISAGALGGAVNDDGPLRAPTARKAHTMTTTPLRVTVWGENVHEQVEQHVAERYPEGMHGAIAAGIREHLPEAWSAPRPCRSPSTA